ncbi:MFS transporter [Sphingomonas parapaucimobilis]|uniref:Putative major facilitator superfamily transporter n=1 Tax=Sphingomonas parapaucimobilis NBRC 15100 TaxID=1219049 RepID=A0A0A1W957_9SPHN|nr:nitrate/nitrite transporter [Sphingomonas parapaucimobilis]GAM01838.1 putative major facilitator superfamily transporter [Sphingomonas parapaucimobilis NBRC 15100]
MNLAAPPPQHRALLVLLVSTLAFAVTFAAWMMFGVTGIPIRKELGLTASEFGLLTATPVLTGAVLRLIFGIWTDRFGGRAVMTWLLAGSALPLWISSYATQFWQFLAIGLVLGVVGATFSVGTPYVARFFTRSRGFAMGVFGAGVSGAALNMFVAPQLITHFGWQSVPRVYALCLLAMALLFRLVALPDPGKGKSSASIGEQLQVLRDPRVWKYCQYYSIVFGGFTALSIWMPQYFLNQYHLPIARAALLATCFSLPGGVLRAMGGWLSDRFGPQPVTWWVLWAAWICLFLLSYPPTDLTIQTMRGPLTLHLALPLWAFAGLMFVLGVSFACGMASTFKYIGDDFPENMGAVSGVVGMAGGLGGFLLPILFGALLDLTGIPSTCFMLLYGIVWVSLILLYVTEIRRMRVLGTARAAQA